MSFPDFFADRMNADIRQKMEGVLALTEQLGRQRLSADGEACVASVADAAAAVARLIDTERDLRCVTLDGPTLNVEPVRLRELMDEIEGRWQVRSADAGVTLLVSYDGDPEGAALDDRRRLLQVFDGFIGEAVAAQARGAVEAGLHAYIHPDGVHLEGRVRGPRDTSWDHKDTEARIQIIEERLGLEVAMGAMLSRQILDGMNGVQRKQANAGASDTATFEIVLAHVPEAAKAVSETAGRQAHILVVDDNATNRMVAQSLVEMFDCTSEAVEDGNEAVEAAKSGRFDLILMDIRMPIMDGVTATRAIRALPGQIGGVPIIALTANADPEDAVEYLAAGMNGVVEKPMKPEQLRQALNSALSGPGNRAAA